MEHATPPQEQGRLIVFEGIDGCGKSTQAEMLYDCLKKHNRPVIHVREPGTTPAAEAVRKILLSTHDSFLSPEAELFLYLAARADLYKQTILPALQEGRMVLSDRCFWSTVAYQGGGLHLGVDHTYTLSLYATEQREPDFVFLFDLSPGQAALRRTGAGDRIESRSPAYLEEVRQTFLQLARQNAATTKVMDATCSIEEIHRRVVTETERFLQSPLSP